MRAEIKVLKRVKNLIIKTIEDNIRDSIRTLITGIDEEENKKSNATF